MISVDDIDPGACIAPVDEGCENLCGAVATELRDVAGVTVGLCAEHAREFDKDGVDGGQRWA